MTTVTVWKLTHCQLNTTRAASWEVVFFSSREVEFDNYLIENKLRSIANETTHEKKEDISLIQKQKCTSSETMKIYFLVTIFCGLASVEGRPYILTNDDFFGKSIYTQKRHSRGHRHKHNVRMKIAPILFKAIPEDSFASQRVTFAAEKPILPPGSVLNSGEDLKKLEKLAKEIAVERETTMPNEILMGKSRAKRFTEELHVERVCKSVSEWVERTTAEDIWGNTVEVLQKIDIGNALVNQYFYETYCENVQAACNGIDTRLYHSVCSDKHIWTYAKVRTQYGEEGWALIKVRGSCNCSLFKRSPQQAIIDLFSTSER